MDLGHPILLDGDTCADQLFDDLQKRAAALVARGTIPKIVTILVGDDPASSAYVGRKHDTCARLGVASEDTRLPYAVDQDTLLGLIHSHNVDPAVDGILVQLPLPQHLDPVAISAAIDPRKDVDGLHPVNLGKLMMGTPDIMPCTPAGIVHLLRHYRIPLAGQRVAIVGRGMLVGRPLAMLLSLKGIDAQVSLLHQACDPIGDTLRSADIVISAAGQPDLIDASMIRAGACVVGVGISYDTAGKMVSDIADDVVRVAGAVTPRHGSVGALTRAKLMENLIQIASRRASISPKDAPQ
ncbi:MAG: bifunctional 5,10-methylenetetrahydrofolate dehydrogenase/5,10-methenyltetrahydrofolate cyclohydrolase [Sulfitobacter sp.]